MPKPEQGHFHCIECGTLFEAAVMDPRAQRCPVCGNPPTGKILAGTERDRVAASVVRSDSPQSSTPPELHGVSRDTREIYEATVEAQKKKRHGRVKRTKRKEKKSKQATVLVVLWLMLMVATVLIVKHFTADEEAVVQFEVTQERERQRAVYEAQKNRMTLEAALPQCEAAMTSFLNAPSSASKAQFVYRGADLSGMMARYYRNNPSFSSTRGSIKITRADLLKFEGKKVIGSLCRNSLGEKFEAVFVQVGKEWKIDWLSLIRYDETSWPLFQSGVDGDEGEFRLYMRVRDTNKDLEQKEMSIVFYKPSMYVKNEFTGLASSAVQVGVDTPLGKRIKELLDSEDGLTHDVYGLPTEEFDPPGYHRVRVKLRLNKKEGKPVSMELLKIIANDWYGIEQLKEKN